MKKITLTENQLINLIQKIVEADGESKMEMSFEDKKELASEVFQRIIKAGDAYIQELIELNDRYPVQLSRRLDYEKGIRPGERIRSITYPDGSKIVKDEDEF